MSFYVSISLVPPLISNGIESEDTEIRLYFHAKCFISNLRMAKVHKTVEIVRSSCCCYYFSIFLIRSYLNSLCFAECDTIIRTMMIVGKRHTHIQFACAVSCVHLLLVSVACMFFLSYFVAFSSVVCVPIKYKYILCCTFPCAKFMTKASV